MTELNSFERDSTDIKTEQEVVKELNSFEAPITTTTTTTTNKNFSNITTPAPVKPKTAAEITQELNSFKAPAKKSSDTLNSLNNFNP